MISLSAGCWECKSGPWGPEHSDTWPPEVRKSCQWQSTFLTKGEFPNVKLVAFACRKKKGTQSEAITLAEKLAQASNIDIFESTSQAFQDSGCWKFSENKNKSSCMDMESKFKTFVLIVVKKKTYPLALAQKVVWVVMWVVKQLKRGQLHVCLWHPDIQATTRQGEGKIEK